MMKKRIFTLCLLSTFCFPTIAASEQATAVDNLNPDQKFSEQQQKAMVSGADCEQIFSKYQTNGADYVPGVDVRGNAITAADLDAEEFDFDFPDSIEFDLKVNALEDRLTDTQAQPQSAPPADEPSAEAPLENVGKNVNLQPLLQANLGRIAYNILSGKLTYNGKPLTADQNHALLAACLSHRKRKSQE